MTLRFSCDDCVARRTDHCGDCLVTFLQAEAPEAPGVSTAVVVELDEWRALTRLQHAGLAPRLRYRGSDEVGAAPGGAVGSAMAPIGVGVV